jgi:hypothetical protein
MRTLRVKPKPRWQGVPSQPEVHACSRSDCGLALRRARALEDLYRARFDGKVPEVRVEGGTVTVKYRPSLHPTRGEITLTKRIPWSIHAPRGHLRRRGRSRGPGAQELGGLRGASKIEARLPRPKDAVRIRIGTGAGNVVLIRPAGCPSGFTSAAEPRSWPSTISPAAGRRLAKLDYDQLEERYDSRSVRERARSRSEPDHPGQSVRGFGLWKLASDS